MALVDALVMTSWVLYEGLYGIFRHKKLSQRSLDLLCLLLATLKCFREFQYATDAGQLHMMLNYCRMRKFEELSKGSNIALDSRLLYFHKFF